MSVYRTDPQNAKEKAASARGRNSRRKGAQLERDVVNLFKAFLPTNVIAWRGLQSKGGGCNPDVSVRYADTKEPILHCEMKKGKRPNIPKAYQQAVDEHSPGSIPVAITQADRDYLLVTMKWDDWTSMFAGWLSLQELPWKEDDE